MYVTTWKQCHDFQLSLNDFWACNNVVLRHYATSRKVAGSRPSELNYAVFLL
jgi:hypothetical protein